MITHERGGGERKKDNFIENGTAKSERKKTPTMSSTRGLRGSKRVIHKLKTRKGE